MERGMTERLTHDTFADRIGDAFRVVPPEGVGDPFDIELIQIRTFEATDLSQRGQAFALEFRGPNDKVLSQGMWHLEHPDLGANDIFLVPVGPDESGMCYEAVFN